MIIQNTIEPQPTGGLSPGQTPNNTKDKKTRYHKQNKASFITSINVQNTITTAILQGSVPGQTPYTILKKGAKAPFSNLF